MGTSVAPTLQSPAIVDLFETSSPDWRESRRRPPRADASWSGAEGQRRDKVNGSVVRDAGTHGVCASSECFGCGDVLPGGSQAARAIRTAALGDARASSTGGLSTEWSPPALQSSRGRRELGGFISGGASHLDAFSGYPRLPSLPGAASGETAGTRAGSPTRSSRTGVRAPQPSNARDGYRPNCLTTF